MPALPSNILRGLTPVAVRAPAMQREWMRIALQYTPICAVTFLAKLSMPPFGHMGLGLDLPILLVATLAGLGLGRFQVHTGRLLLYLLMLGWLGCTQLVRGELFSAASIVMLALLFLPLTLQLRATPAARLGADDPLQAALRVMSGLATFFAVCGVLQYGLQYVAGAKLAFPIEHGLPSALLIEKFNYLIPVREGAQTLKSNGVFFLEPSFYSQFMALGLLLELSLRNRPAHIVLLVAALALSYSGTGVIVASVGIAALVVMKRRWDIVLLGATVALLALLFADALNLQQWLGRATEFQSSRSSGSARFVAWIDMFRQQWWHDEWRVLFGAGAGSFASNAAVARMATAEMSFSKMLFEYGVLGATLFFGFLAYAFNSVRAPLAFRFGLTASLFLNGPYAAFPVGIAASILLWPALSRPKLASPPRPAPSLTGDPS